MATTSQLKKLAFSPPKLPAVTPGQSRGANKNRAEDFLAFCRDGRGFELGIPGR